MLGEVDGDGEDDDDDDDDDVLGFGDWTVDGVSVSMEGIFVAVVGFWQ